MKMHTILEVEEGALNVVVGGRDGSQTRVIRSQRLPLSDFSREALDGALRAVGSDVLHGGEGLHVIIGDRRAQHFVSKVPKMSARDAVAFATREGMRLANLQSAEDLMVETRLVRSLPQGKLQISTCALARSIWEPLRDVLAKHHVAVLSLQTMEACLARSESASGSEPVAIVECNGGRARLVISVDGAPVQVRRFMVSGGAGNVAGVLTQLAMEVPRTMDWLRETGQPLPSRMVVGPRVGVDTESLNMLEGDELSEVVCAEALVDRDEGASEPGLAVATLLHELCTGAPVASLLDAARIRLPWAARQVMAVAVALIVAGLAAFGAVVEGQAWLEVRAERESVDALLEDVQYQLANLELREGDMPVVQEDPGLTDALKMRRPISLLISEACNQCGESVRLQEVVFASRGMVIVTGVVDGAGHQQALASLAQFTQALRELPYLVPVGRDEVTEVAGATSRFQFKITLSWRHE